MNSILLYIGVFITGFNIAMFFMCMLFIYAEEKKIITIHKNNKDLDKLRYVYYFMFDNSYKKGYKNKKNK